MPRIMTVDNVSLQDQDASSMQRGIPCDTGDSLGRHLPLGSCRLHQVNLLQHDCAPPVKQTLSIYSNSANPRQRFSIPYKFSVQLA
jgi:hypothetical protein